MCKVLIVDAPVGNLISTLLAKAGYETIEARGIKTGVEKALMLPFGSVIVAASNLSEGGVIEFSNQLEKEDCALPVIAIVDNYNNGANVAEIMRCRNIVDTIQRGIIENSLVEMVRRYGNEGLEEMWYHNLLPEVSKTWQSLEKKINAIASTDSNVIIFGECGTGKGQIATHIWRMSSRADMPVKVLEAGGASLVERVYPNEKCSDIYTRIKSYFRQVAGGTLIVKNIEFLTMDKQSVLLHILQQERHNVRLICTADPKLLVMANNDEFRKDLFYFLRSSNIMTPALRDITDEIKVIAEYIIEKDAEARNVAPKRLAANAVKALTKLDWPGNLRELKNLVLLAARTCKGTTITKDDLDLELCEPHGCESEKLHCPKEEKRKIENAIKKYKNKKQASEALGISRGKLDERIKRYGIDIPGISDAKWENNAKKTSSDTSECTPEDAQDN